jgi:hypothetical protein
VYILKIRIPDFAPVEESKSGILFWYSMILPVNGLRLGDVAEF